MFPGFKKQVFAVTDDIPSDCDVVFVSDMFLSDYQGGAELTSDALIKSSPFKVHSLHSKDVNLTSIQRGSSKFWIFGNFSAVDPQMLPIISRNLRYTVLEYDYKYCRYRSPEKHAVAEGNCFCESESIGQAILSFYQNAKKVWWMSEGQRDFYCQRFPVLSMIKSEVLSSVFDDEFFRTVSDLRREFLEVPRKGWVVLGSPSWVKGFEAAKQWCQDNEREYEVVWDLPYDEVLRKLARAEGFVYLPAGKDTCPRMVIEAKLLGCSLELNSNVQHSGETWFNGSVEEVELYLKASRERFWSGVNHCMGGDVTISGYTTTLNCVKQRYPFVQSIQSMMGFCEEVVVVDGGSTDGTIESLLKIAWPGIDVGFIPKMGINGDGHLTSLVNFTGSLPAPKIQVYVVSRDWSSPRFAVFDGLQKAEARKLCTKRFCWQQDSDEIVHEDDYQKIRGLAGEIPDDIDLLALPTVEYWGSSGKIRVDVHPWKWRISQNKPTITHGIPGALRQVDADGLLYASPGTDGCDYIYTDTLNVVPCATFYTSDMEKMRQAALADPTAVEEYSKFVRKMCESLPTIHHYSWFDMGRKVRTYRDYWSKHWQSLFNITQADTAENNMFFDKPWSEVSEEEIDNLSARLSREMGGWIFHRKVDFNQKTPSIECPRRHPKLAESIVDVVRRDPKLVDLSMTVGDLIQKKGDDNWCSVRGIDGNYEVVILRYPFGERKALRSIRGREKYQNLQESRSVRVDHDDDASTILSKVVASIDDIKESDRVRIDELDRLLGQDGAKVVGVTELGFRVPNLLKFYQTKGATKCVGYDISRLSLETGRLLGYDVREYDLNDPVGSLDLAGTNVVISYHVLEHLTDPLRAVKRIFDSMRVGSYFHVEIPVEPDGPMIQYAHLFPFHVGDLRAMLNIAGFTVLSESTVTHSDGPHIERCLARRDK